MKKLTCTALLVLILAAPAAAQLSEKYRDWVSGPVKWLITDDEMAEWEAVDDDAEAKAFIDLFWARRDPSPATPYNENRHGFEELVEFAEEAFAEPATRGSLTDRGRVFLLFGSPARINRTTGLDAPSADTEGSGAMSGASSSGDRENWHYEGEHVPRVADDKEFSIAFVDRLGTGQFSMISRRSINEMLEKSRDFYVSQPDLDALPEYPAAVQAPVAGVAAVEEPVTRPTELQNEALAAAIEELEAASAERTGQLHLTHGEFVTPNGETFVPVQLYLPGSAAIDPSEDLTLFGVIETQDGEVVTVVEEPAALLASKSDVYLDRSLDLEPGSYVAIFGLARGDEAIAMARTDITVEGIAASDRGVSDLILTNNIFALSEAQLPTDPYAFGGVKVVPKGDATFARAEEIWYFVELRNPGLSEDGEPVVRLKLDVDGTKADGNRAKMSAPMMEVDAQPARDTEGHYLVAGSFPSGAFAPGSYTLIGRLFDAVSQETWNLEAEFEIVE